MDIGGGIIIILVVASVAYQIRQWRRGRAEPSNSDYSPSPTDGHGIDCHHSHSPHGDCGDHGGGDFGADCGAATEDTDIEGVATSKA